MTDLERVCTPPPQSSEQADQVFQPDTTQSTGHENVLQRDEDLSFSQRTPPLAAEMTTDRVLVFEPPPQVAVQELKEDHSETLQSTGQAKLLQTISED
jgi:hypothetical protein